MKIGEVIPKNGEIVIVVLNRLGELNYNRR